MGAKTSPAFQFYPRDFLVSTAAMTVAECGAYIKLLCYAWDHDGIPTDTKRLARIVGVSEGEFGELWEALAEKWAKRGTMLVNRRMEEVRKKQDDFKNQQAEAGRKGAKARWKNGDPNGDPNGETMATPSSENGDPNGDPNGERHGETMALHSASAFDPSTTSEVKGLSLVQTSSLLQTVVGRFRQISAGREPELRIDEAAIGRTLDDFQHMRDIERVAADCAEWMAGPRGKKRTDVAATLRNFLKRETETRLATPRPPPGPSEDRPDPSEQWRENYVKRLAHVFPADQVRRHVDAHVAKTGRVPLLPDVHRALSEAG